MAFPFYVLNIAYMLAGFKYLIHVDRRTSSHPNFFDIDKNVISSLIKKKIYDILSIWETIEQAAALHIGGANPPDERKEGNAMYVTYSDLVQIGIFIVALVGLCYTVFKGKRK